MKHSISFPDVQTRLSLVSALACLVVTSLPAQTVIDDFDDDSRDVALWQSPVLVQGTDPQLLEQNQRLEFTASAAEENEIRQELNWQAPYDRAWQVQLLVSVDPASFAAEGEDGSLSIGIGSTAPGNNHITIGQGAGILPGTAENQAIFSEGSDVSGRETQNLDVRPLPPAIGIRIAYDPHRRLIQTYYDLNADPTDGAWTLFQSYTIDGSGDPADDTLVILNWGMSETDTFRLALGAHSSNAAMAPGSAWVDDLQAATGQRLLAPTVADDFNDGTRDPVKWGDPDPEGNEQLVEQNGRLEFSAPAAAESFISQAVRAYPGYNQAWQAQAVLSMDESNFTALGELGVVSLELGSSTPGDQYIDIGYAAGLVPGLTGRQAILSEGADNANPDGTPLIDEQPLPEAIAVRMTYDPHRRVVRTYYTLDTELSGADWIFAQAYTIDGFADPDNPDLQSLNWGMSDTDTFYLVMAGYAEGAGVAAGSAWIDDFSLHIGPTVESSTPLPDSGLALMDNFNDDSWSSIWQDPSDLQGTPELVESNHRVEFTSPGTGEDNIQRTVTPNFWPQFDQSFEFEVEVHSFPANMSVQDQAVGMELVIANDAGDGDLLLGVGTYFTEGTAQQLVYADDSELQTPDDFPEVVTWGALPAIVGLRIAWDADAKLLSCYLDTDGNRATTTWTLFADYTLDGSSQGTTHTTDWHMTASDHFRIGLSAGGGGTAVQGGEAYFDNFAFHAKPLLGGYDLWTSAIPDPSMRDQNLDASGNGIQNLLQYLYGLSPLATDTEVELRIELQNGSPTLTHGINEEATDYILGYQYQNSLFDPWTWATVEEASSVETFDSNGKRFRRITFPFDAARTFVRVAVPSE